MPSASGTSSASVSTRTLQVWASSPASAAKASSTPSSCVVRVTATSRLPPRSSASASRTTASSPSPPTTPSSASPRPSSSPKTSSTSPATSSATPSSTMRMMETYETRSAKYLRDYSTHGFGRATSVVGVSRDGPVPRRSVEEELPSCCCCGGGIFRGSRARCIRPGGGANGGGAFSFVWVSSCALRVASPFSSLASTSTAVAPSSSPSSSSGTNRTGRPSGQ
mmetsp:Transcript_5534/g.17445  ORF Transcript_5534/g.17445 Transcript_5534/m.17445 type:complete len:223 (+) Transcript_5534:1056-1724(+)